MVLLVTLDYDNCQNNVRYSYICSVQDYIEGYIFIKADYSIATEILLLQKEV